MNSAVPPRILEPLTQPELIMGLVAPLGVDLDLAQKVLSERLAEVGYTPVIIHITERLRYINLETKVSSTTYDERIQGLIQRGNEFREKTQLQEACAVLGLLSVRDERQKRSGKYESPLSKTAYIIRQLKRTEEIALLKSVYQDQFFCISYYANTNYRAHRLAQRIFDSGNRSGTAAECMGAAHALITRDNNEVTHTYGQRVSDAFAFADVVIDASSSDAIREDTRRFVRLIFGDEFISPTREEYGMYLANSAALRSRDLSRQVGCAIMTKQSEVVALGSNEVPKAKGGTYWPDDLADARDFRLGEDPSAKMKQRIIREIVARIQSSGKLKLSLIAGDGQNDKFPESDDIYDLLTRPGGILDGSIVSGLLEFGRIVHAEMSALADAARLGRSVRECVLFTNTFPCHMCARQIIASGISEVVFWQPYHKSLALDLHSDSIDRDSCNSGVRFSNFVGVTPHSFQQMFRMKRKRKDGEGAAAIWSVDNARPISRVYAAASIAHENAVIVAAAGAFERLGFTSPSD